MLLDPETENGFCWRGARSVVGVVSLIIRATEARGILAGTKRVGEMVYHLVLMAGAWPGLDTQNLFVSEKRRGREEISALFISTKTN